MRIALCFAVAALGAACATQEQKPIGTQVVTVPDGVFISCNGTNAGRSPAVIVLPQDANGRLTGRAEVRAMLNNYQTNDAHLFAQTRIFDPETRIDRVPDRIMIDMTLPVGTNTLSADASTEQVIPEKNPFPGKIPYTERSKPTQAVGLDRWNPERP
jgi:hypothetical protein